MRERLFYRGIGLTDAHLAQVTLHGIDLISGGKRESVLREASVSWHSFKRTYFGTHITLFGISWWPLRVGLSYVTFMGQLIDPYSTGPNGVLPFDQREIKADVKRVLKGT